MPIEDTFCTIQVLKAIYMKYVFLKTFRIFIKISNFLDILIKIREYINHIYIL